MVFNPFFFKTLGRVALIAASLISLSYIFGRSDLFFTQVLIGVTVLIQLYELTYFISTTNRELSRFLNSIKSGDYAVNFTSNNHSHSFKKLNQSFKGIVELLKIQETQREAQYQFLRQIVDQIDFGIICFNEQEEIELMNKKASELLQIPVVRKWNNLNNPNTSILTQFLAIRPSNKNLVETTVNGQKRILSINTTKLKSLEQKFRITSFNDIRNEIQAKEIEAWHKLIRILTHEIMNSVTPLLSLIDTMELILTEKSDVKSSLEKDEVEDLYEASQTIKERNVTMLKFVQDFRKLTRISIPEKSQIQPALIFHKVSQFYKSDFQKYNINYSTKAIDKEIEIDPTLIEQVLINLVKNSIDAYKDAVNNNMLSIEMNFYEEEYNWVIEVRDDGPGIEIDKLEKVTIPFYTTKKEGSGIGLALTRQILNLHGGYLDISSEPNTFTSVKLFIPRN